MADNMMEGEPHECEKRVQQDVKVRVDLSATPLKDADEVLFTDGCCYRHPMKGLKAAFAVVRQTAERFEEVETGPVKGKESAQLAELQAVIRALEHSKGKKVTIYTDSAYVVGAIQVELSQWIRAGFLTASKTPIKHEQEMRRLAEALLLPKEVAVVKCQGHSKAQNPVARGNTAADEAAKRAAGYQPTFVMIQTENIVQDILPKCDVNMLIKEQEKASQHENTVWIQRGAIQVEGLWRAVDGRPVLPPGIRNSVLQEAHGPGHVGPRQMLRALSHWWHPFLPGLAQIFVKRCEICTDYNPRPTLKPHEGQFPLPHMPGQEIIIDFTDMGDRVRGYRYLLVAVDAYTGWPEALPAKVEDGKTVVKFLVNHYIPVHGFPKRIR